MGQQYVNKIQKTYMYKDAAGYCPHCNYARSIGDITCQITANNVDEAALDLIKINIYDILSDYTQTINNPHIISLECPECHHSMVFLDKSIAKSIAVLNSLGIYTEYSCDGREDQHPYVSFDHNSFKILVMILTAVLAKDAKIEILKAPRDQGSPIMIFHDQTNGTNQLVDLLSQHHFDLTHEAIYANTSARYNKHPVVMSSDPTQNFINLMTILKLDLRNMIVTWYNLLTDKTSGYKHRYPYENRIAKKFALMITSKQGPSAWDAIHLQNPEKCTELLKIHDLLSSVDLAYSLSN